MTYIYNHLSPFHIPLCSWCSLFPCQVILEIGLYLLCYIYLSTTKTYNVPKTYNDLIFMYFLSRKSHYNSALTSKTNSTPFLLAVHCFEKFIFIEMHNMHNKIIILTSLFKALLKIISLSLQKYTLLLYFYQLPFILPFYDSKFYNLSCFF